MSRKRKSDEALGILALIVEAPILFANWIHDKIGLPQPVTYTVLGLIVIGVLWLYFAERNKKFRAIRIANIDLMSGVVNAPSAQAKKGWAAVKNGWARTDVDYGGNRRTSYDFSPRTSKLFSNRRTGSMAR